MAYPNKKCTFANRVVRRSKSQNISALALSLNRYHKSATPPFYSDIQSDTSFLIIRGKDSARRAQDKRKSHRIFFFHAEPQPILSKDSARREKNEKQSRKICFSYSEPQPILLKDYGFPVENQDSL